jgi:hypothetical protein
MSKRKWVAAKLFAMLGGVSLAIGICVPRASAQVTVPPFSATNYANRYECNVTADENFYTATMLLYPNGAGTYTDGSLVAALSAFTTFNPTAPPEENTCSYSLILPASSYTVTSDGIVTEVLSWKAASANSASCPLTFVMSNTDVLRANVNAAGKVQNLQITSSNLLNEDDPGKGQCLK